MTNLNGWDSVGVEETNGNGGGTTRKEREIDFLALPEGDTVIRILDAVPYKYNEWWAVNGDGGGKNGKGCRIPYHGAGKDLLEKANQEFMNKKFAEADAKGLKDKARKDFLRDQGYKKQPFGKLKTKYIIHVLDRATGEVKLLDSTSSIFEGIKKIAGRKGDPREYDLVINREGLGFQDTEYTVIYDEKSPLTEAELKLYEKMKVDLEELKGAGFCTPEQALQVAKGAKWDNILNNAPETAPEASQSTPESHTEVSPQEAPQRQDEPVEVSNDEELTAEELEDISFE